MNMIEEMEEELADIHATPERYRLKRPHVFRKVASGRKLWHYDKKELDVWKAAS